MFVWVVIWYLTTALGLPIRFQCILVKNPIWDHSGKSRQFEPFMFDPGQGLRRWFWWSGAIFHTGPCLEKDAQRDLEKIRPSFMP